METCPTCEGRRTVLFVSRSDPRKKLYACCSRCGGVGVIGREFKFGGECGSERLRVPGCGRHLYRDEVGMGRGVADRLHP